MREDLPRLALMSVIVLFAGACAVAPPAAPAATTAPPPTATPLTPVSPTLTLVPPTSTTAAVDPREGEKLYRAFLDAYNRGDVDAAVGFLVAEGLVYRVSEFVGGDRAAVKAALEGEGSMGKKLEILNCVEKGSQTACEVAETIPFCVKAYCGLDLLHGLATIQTKDGEIKQLVLMANRPDEQVACAAAYPKFAAWGQENRPDDWQRLFGEPAQLVTGKAWGELASALCQAYLDSQK